MASQFSNDGKYFAQITDDGKLKLWDTSAGTFEQEFVPDFHLTSPCTCLHFVDSLDSYSPVSNTCMKNINDFMMNCLCFAVCYCEILC